MVFAPFDEDYGYVTLEAFEARKPVVTASDSGGAGLAEVAVDPARDQPPACPSATRKASIRRPILRWKWPCR